MPQTTEAGNRTEQRGATLLAIARDALHGAHGLPAIPWADAPWLGAPGATFVTLTAAGELRGCIGTLTAFRALREDVAANALGAAFRDPRFPPVAAEEVSGVTVEVSELFGFTELRPAGREAALALLAPGHGYVLESGRHRGTFLPQVWEQLPDPSEFLAHLEQKAGLTAGAWAAGVSVVRYRVRKWSEQP